MRKATAAFLVLALMGMLAGCQNSQRAKTAKPVSPTAPGGAKNRLVMTVGEAKVYEKELNQEFVRRTGGGYAHGKGKPGFDLMVRRVLQDVALGKMLLQQAKKENVNVPPQELAAEMDMIRQRSGGEDQFLQGLKMKGETLESLEKLVADALQVKKLMEKHRQRFLAPQTPQQEKAWFEAHKQEFLLQERVRASHILLSCEGKRDCLAKGTLLRAKLIKKELMFEDAARQHSKDPGSAPRGGDLGYFNRGQMVPPFEEAAFALEPGGLSEPVMTQFGVHLIKLTDKKPAGAATFEEAQPILRQRREAQASEKARQSLLALLKKNYAVTPGKGFGQFFPGGDVFAPINAPPPVLNLSGSAPAGQDAGQGAKP